MSHSSPREAALQRATEWFVRLDASAVSEEARAQFFSWLEENELHQQAYIEIEKLWGKLAIVDRLPMPAARPGWLEWLFRPSGVFAGLVLILATGLLYLQLAAPAQQQYATAVGERREFLLEDGSRLHLNTNTEVTVAMDGKRRFLQLLRGEAYFDVAHDPAWPLVVQTPGGLVRVLGTRFNIRETEHGSRVTVIEGVVAVAAETAMDSAFDPLFEADIMLTAQQQSTLEHNAQPTSPQLTTADSVLAWREGRLVFDGVTLAEVIADIDRYFPGTIRLDDPSLAEEEVFGILDLQNRSATLKALEATFKVQAVQVSDQLTLIKRRLGSP
ncbi:MAG: FecR family protein [Gammaproteobacteria bacterium]|nr:FecR family protein [Gammaproteobacteria bacterium]